MNHKRGRPKSQRGGCLMCKPWKHQGEKGAFNAQTTQERRAIESEQPERSWPSRRPSKPYTIEHYARWRGGWYVHRRYETEAARDTALANLLRKEQLPQVYEAYHQNGQTEVRHRGKEPTYRVGPTAE